MNAGDSARRRPAIRSASSCAYMLRLGSLGFGGPVALVRRTCTATWSSSARWISEADYKEGLALAQLMPGRSRRSSRCTSATCTTASLGATLVGIAFVMPSFLMVVALGWAYVRFGGLAVDAGGVLRRRRGGHRHHRDERVQAHREEHRHATGCSGRSTWWSRPSPS